MGSVQSGTTVSDYDAEEIKRHCSVNTSLMSVEWANTKINILDTPGFFDFESEKISGLTAADCAVIVISGKSGVDVGSEKVWDYCKKHSIPVCFFVNKNSPQTLSTATFDNSSGIEVTLQEVLM